MSTATNPITTAEQRTVTAEKPIPWSAVLTVVAGEHRLRDDDDPAERLPGLRVAVGLARISECEDLVVDDTT